MSLHSSAMPPLGKVATIALPALVGLGVTMATGGNVVLGMGAKIGTQMALTHVSERHAHEGATGGSAGDHESLVERLGALAVSATAEVTSDVLHLDLVAPIAAVIGEAAFGYPLAVQHQLDAAQAVKASQTAPELGAGRPLEVSGGGQEAPVAAPAPDTGVPVAETALAVGGETVSFADGGTLPLGQHGPLGLQSADSLNPGRGTFGELGGNGVSQTAPELGASRGLEVGGGGQEAPTAALAPDTGAPVAETAPAVGGETVSFAGGSTLPIGQQGPLGLPSADSLNPGRGTFGELGGNAVSQAAPELGASRDLEVGGGGHEDPMAAQPPGTGAPVAETAPAVGGETVSFAGGSALPVGQQGPLGGESVGPVNSGHGTSAEHGGNEVSQTSPELGASRALEVGVGGHEAPTAAQAPGTDMPVAQTAPAVGGETVSFAGGGAQPVTIAQEAKPVAEAPAPPAPPPPPSPHVGGI